MNATFYPSLAFVIVSAMIVFGTQSCVEQRGLQFNELRIACLESGGSIIEDGGNSDFHCLRGPVTVIDP